MDGDRCTLDFLLLHPIICHLILRQVQALEQAYDYWEKFQFDIIAAKVCSALDASREGFTLTRVQLDAGLRSFRTMASKVLRPKVGGDTPREAPISDREPSITPGTMENRTVQPGGFLNSQSETIMI